MTTQFPTDEQGRVLMPACVGCSGLLAGSGQVPIHIQLETRSGLQLLVPMEEMGLFGLYKKLQLLFPDGKEPRVQ
jgi:hypothetical protein